MKNSLIERYSDGIIGAAVDQNLEDELFSEITVFARMLPDILDNTVLLEEADAIPGASLSISKALISKLKPGILLERLILLLATRHRLQILPAVTAEVATKLKAKRGIVEAKVTSTRELSETEKDNIITRLRRLTHCDIDVFWIIDPSILGGITMQLGDFLIDGSLKTRMEKLRKHLLKPQGE